MNRFIMHGIKYLTIRNWSIGYLPSIIILDVFKIQRFIINERGIVFAAPPDIEVRRASRWLGRQQFLGTTIV